MILDNFTRLSSSQDISAGGLNVPSTNTIEQGGIRDAGYGESVYARLRVVQARTGGTATFLRVGIVNDDAGTFLPMAWFVFGANLGETPMTFLDSTSWTFFAALGPALQGITGGVVIPTLNRYRNIRGAYHSDGTMTSLIVDLDIVVTPHLGFITYPASLSNAT